MANTLHMYSISFKGLKLGKHRFVFEINDRFFQEFKEGEISRGQLKAEVLLMKQNNLLELGCKITGTVNIPCDRCTELFDLPISYKGKLYVKIGAEENRAEDDIIFLTTDEHEIDLTQHLYESICLSLPIMRYHGLNGTNPHDCDAEMLQHLNSTTANSSDTVDPRWAKLNEIRMN